jgi:hypothetical protein
MKVRFPGFGREIRRIAVRAAAAGCVRIARRAQRRQRLVRVSRSASFLVKEFRRELGRARRRLGEGEK